MKKLQPIFLGLVGSWLVGLAAGYAWTLGNRVAEGETLRLVVLAVPTNLGIALLLYGVTRGCVATTEGGLGLFFTIAGLGLPLALGTAAQVSGTLGSGTGNVGAHTFSWGMSYAYGQAYFDVKNGTWFGDSES